LFLKTVNFQIKSSIVVSDVRSNCKKQVVFSINGIKKAQKVLAARNLLSFLSYSI